MILPFEKLCAFLASAGWLTVADQPLSPHGMSTCFIGDMPFIVYGGVAAPFTDPAFPQIPYGPAALVNDELRASLLATGSVISEDTLNTAGYRWSYYTVTAGAVPMTQWFAAGLPVMVIPPNGVNVWTYVYPGTPIALSANAQIRIAILSPGPVNALISSSWNPGPILAFSAGVDFLSLAPSSAPSAPEYVYFQVPSINTYIGGYTDLASNRTTPASSVVASGDPIWSLLIGRLAFANDGFLSLARVMSASGILRFGLIKLDGFNEWAGWGSNFQELSYGRGRNTFVIADTPGDVPVPINQTAGPDPTPFSPNKPLSFYSDPYGPLFPPFVAMTGALITNTAGVGILRYGAGSQPLLAGPNRYLQPLLNDEFGIPTSTSLATSSNAVGSTLNALSED